MATNARAHDFVAKLSHPKILPEVIGMVRARAHRDSGSIHHTFRSQLAGVSGPLSINLDLTVACNYACPHCIDGKILNTGRRYSFDDVVGSLIVLRLAGLRSVILIGGGEPTIYPEFAEAVAVIKYLGLQCAVVSNGGNIRKLAEIAPRLTSGDWIRLSLDAANDSTFQIMHLPRKRVSLHEICAAARSIKAANSAVSLGFSFIISWRGASVDAVPIQDNVGEIATAAQLAKESGFDYISFKPILDRDIGGAEVIALLEKKRDTEAILDRIRSQIAEAKALDDERFRVLESVNLLALFLPERYTKLRKQPRHCHMHLLRQVLTPVGSFGCPVYRGVKKAKVGDPQSYRSVEAFVVSRRESHALAAEFDASRECCNVTCLYNSTNWWLEAMRQDAVQVSPLVDSLGDLFM